MTRWARRGGAAAEKALAATPWEEMAGREGGPGPRPGKREQEKRKKKKKEYLNEDVNGFAAFLRQSCPSGEAAEALRKDRRREGRRLRRQEMKKNAMVSFALGRGSLPAGGSLLKAWGKAPCGDHTSLSLLALPGVG